MPRRSGAEQVGQGFSEQAGPDDFDALPTLAVRRDGLVGVISRYRLVDDRDPFPADPFPAAEASFLFQFFDMDDLRTDKNSGCAGE